MNSKIGFLLCLAFILGLSCVAQVNTISVMSWNIRLDTPADSGDRWDLRKAGVVQIMKEYHPAFIGVQEALPQQMSYLEDNLTGYQFIGIGREAGGMGEYSAIFYDTTRFMVLTSSTFWLSTTPNQVSIGWDAALPRICTHGEFLSKTDQRVLWVFNTHFDHIGKVARMESTLLIMDYINQITIKEPNSPVILMGDFNSEPESDPIRYISKGMGKPGNALNGKISGPTGTFNDFKMDEPIEKCIDYIFVQNLRVSETIHIDKKLQNNHFPSDHLPVLVRAFK
ncbi:MAG: endonuclease/exonuclease/phosphatase [Bacteroidetes bacterium HGW-Bacteroidetes-16]|jgi:endonuclease/exonuclease/phosphatase family metal-dependent hydrolase|nr:MAG: endonuclease/exonuclease/phosphatase [Bacteroidetes bacterium HGW-Bacteroidetes-16]